MKSISKILVAFSILLSFSACNSQIKNAKTETVKIYGNFRICEKTIEKAGNLKKVGIADWNIGTKMAALTYSAKKTNQDEISKRIALVDYDSDKFLSPNDVYSKLPKGCQYGRMAQTVAKVETPKMSPKEDHSPTTETKHNVNQLTSVFDNYFAVKDAEVYYKQSNNICKS